MGLCVDGFTPSCLISACVSFQENVVAHCVFFKMGFFCNVFFVSGLIENYCKLGFVREGEKCFEECLAVDCVVWTAMINGYVLNGWFSKAREIFLKMRCLGLEINEFCLSGMLGGVFDVVEGEQIHGFLVKIGFLCGCSCYLNNALMSMYGRFGYKDCAVKVFDENPRPDVVSWSGRISVACDGLEAFSLFKMCVDRGLEINEYCITNTLSVIEGTAVLGWGKQIHGFCCKDGYLNEGSVCGALIFMYGKCGKMIDAERLFDEMMFEDSVSWNALISCFSENGHADQAIALFSEMQKSQVEINKYTLASVLGAASHTNSPKQAMQIHSIIVKLGFSSDESMQTCLMTSYGKCNVITESKRLFSEIDCVNIVHLNAMLSTCINAGCHADVLNIFEARWNLCLAVDHVTFTMLFKACGLLTNLDHGKTFHSLVLKLGMDSNVYIRSAVIDAYCKCGSIGDAETAFRDKDQHNVVAWNAMMMGYAQCGRYHEVYNLLSAMSVRGVQPDEITYLSILSSCCHAGLVNEAKYHLNSMFNLHGVVPCLEHYACVIDVLGRVGLLEEAERTISQMSILPDARIWQILLSACSFHGNIDLGQFAASKLLGLQPENDSAFVLLSNLYASAGMWNVVGELRRRMKATIVDKEPGSSWTQIRGAIHYFFAADVSHPECKEIYFNLHFLSDRMMEIPDKEEDDIS
ncbi:pentatricopeptide repeat-containing protein At3g53360, mitochondrial-like [Apium graveolens]|uniref:pentatricopeptide repeat-containing protein At3g53360, mitochondrial-like n=1 Tax=Apium graveolens TaxID=4045 RepID=UPI003D7B7EDE